MYVHSGAASNVRETVPNNGPIDWTNLVGNTIDWNDDAQYVTLMIPQDTPTSPAYITVTRNGRVFFALEDTDSDDDATEMYIPEF